MAVKREACDKWFSDCVRKRANHRCEYCGKGDGQIDCAHIYGRRAKSVRWDGMNAVALCRYHHDYFGSHPLEFQRWLRQHLGEGHLDILREKFNKPMKTNKAMRQEIAKHYRETFRAMEDGEDFISWE